MAGPSVIAYTQFCLSTDEDRLRESCAEITSYELFNPAGEPVPGGVYDLRLGTIDHAYLCLQCQHGKKLCPGHRGSLALRVAVPQPIGIPEIRRWLHAICLTCGRVIADPAKFAQLPAGKRLAAAAAAATEGKACPACRAVHPRISKDPEDHFSFWAEPPLPAERRGRGEPRGFRLYPDTLRAIFERVSDADVRALGRSPASHPRHLILRVVAVPPNTIRPGVKSFGGAGASYHDTTNLLQHLVKRNAALPEELPEAMGPRGPAGVVDGELQRAVQNLQQIYYDLVMGSSATSVTQGSSGRRGLVVGARPVHSLLRNLPRKEGRIRAGLLGKRVFYISRSTISGNTRFRLDEVGVPLGFARTLQVEETVQPFNLEWLMPFFLNGRRQYPGSTLLVRRATGEAHDVAGLRDARLEVGDVLLRDVINGDLAFFNRQPTLERSSIGVHRVIVLQDPSIHTFQFNVDACEGYNADFDGDQMNLWVARHPAARVEAGIMSGIANWFISTKTSGPVNGEVQDAVVGCHELTRSGVVMDKYHAMALFAGAGVEPPRFDRGADGGRRLYTGREVVSLLLEATPFNYRARPASFSEVFAAFIPTAPDETLTVIEEGRLVSGVLDGKAVGAKAAGGVFHVVSREYGPHRALDLIYALQQVALQFLFFRGFTVGPADLLPGPEARARIGELVGGVELEARRITEALLAGEIVPPIGYTVRAYYELLQRNALKANEAEVLRWVLRDIRPDTNGLFRMIADGAKGAVPNLIHISGVIGSTEINGERIQEKFGFRRTCPYFPRFATAPAARGYVANNYMTGMTAPEFLFQDMNGRVDLITKALSTAGSGYFMRKGVMNNQTSVVDNLRRVTKDSRVVQALYGEDGLDARELELVAFRTVPLGDAALRELLWLDVAAAGAAGAPAAVAAAQAAVDAALARAAADRDAFRRAFRRLEAAAFAHVFTKKGADGAVAPPELLMPVHVARIVDGVFVAARGARAPPLTAAGLAGRVAAVEALCARLPYALLNSFQEGAGAPVPPHLAAATRLLATLVRAELGPRTLARLSDEQLAFVVDAVRLRYARSLVDYGTAVGVLAAQGISEPLTQFMLDSHHRSVVSGTGTSAMARVSEIYGARPVAEEQAPVMLLPLRAAALPAEPAAALAAAQRLANHVEFVTLRHFVRAHDTLLEPFGALVYPPYAADAAWIADFERAHPLVRPPGDLTNWCFRFAVEKSALELKAVELELVARNLAARHPGAYVVHTSEAAPAVVIRVWLRAAQLRRGDEQLRALLGDVLDTPIRGIRGVLRASAEALERSAVGADGALRKETRYAIRTVGTNLASAFLFAAADGPAVISSSVGDTLRLLGVEAARSKVISETVAFMERKSPNMRHLQLYADEMFRTGKYTGIERGGLSAREHSNVLLRMAYGAPIQVVTDAALAATKTKVVGMAGPQLLGSVPQIGTLYNSCYVDGAFVRANLRSVDSVLDAL